MHPQEFFPPRPVATPTIYANASTHPDHKGLLKVGSTEREAAERVVGASGARVRVEWHHGVHEA